MKLSELLKRISSLPWKAKAHNIKDQNQQLVTDTNMSCGLTREMDLANAEYLALAANILPELVERLKPFANLDIAHLEDEHDSIPLFQVQKTIITVGDIRKARILSEKVERE